MAFPRDRINPHEAAVAAFMREAKARDPVKYAAVLKRYPVKNATGTYREDTHISLDALLAVGLAPPVGGPWPLHLPGESRHDAA